MNVEKKVEVIFREENTEEIKTDIYLPSSTTIHDTKDRAIERMMARLNAQLEHPSQSDHLFIYPWLAPLCEFHGEVKVVLELRPVIPENLHYSDEIQKKRREKEKTKTATDISSGQATYFNGLFTPEAEKDATNSLNQCMESLNISFESSIPSQFQAGQSDLRRLFDNLLERLRAQEIILGRQETIIQHQAKEIQSQKREIQRQRILMQQQEHRYSVDLLKAGLDLEETKEEYAEKMERSKREHQEAISGVGLNYRIALSVWRDKQKAATETLYANRLVEHPRQWDKENSLMDLQISQLTNRLDVFENKISKLKPIVSKLRHRILLDYARETLGEMISTNLTWQEIKTSHPTFSFEDFRDFVSNSLKICPNIPAKWRDLDLKCVDYIVNPSKLRNDANAVAHSATATEMAEAILYLPEESDDRTRLTKIFEALHNQRPQEFLS